MKFLKKTAIVGLFLSILWPMPMAGAGETLTLATGEWAPYVSNELEGQGFITEIITEVFAEMDMVPVYVFYPWRRCYESVVVGKVWAAFPYSLTEEREKEVLFSDNLSYSVTRFFYYGKPKIKDFNSLKALKSHRIGGVNGYFYEEDFQQAGLNIDFAAKEISAIEKLMMGRIDFLPLNELVGWHLINQNFPKNPEKFGMLDTPYSVNDLNLIVSKNFPDSRKLLKRFNEALQTIKDRYIYQDILERYRIQ